MFTVKELANATLRITKLREDSWNGGDYSLSIYNACRMVVEEPLAQLLCNALIGSWNETVEWAEANK